MTVTLETLKADFQSKLYIFNGPNDGLTCEEFVIAASEAKTENRLYNREAIAAFLAFNIIDVYEKHGRQAAMLYRLSEGAIDPREVS